MIAARSTAYFTRSIRFVAIAGSLCAAILALRGERPARACSGGDWSIAESTTFDPGVLGDPRLEGVYYEPAHSGFGGYQPAYGDDALVADWHGYLKDAVTTADWRKILFEATAKDVVALQQKLAGKPAAVPKAYARSSLWGQPAAKDKLAAALAVVKLARDVEPSTAFYEAWGADTPSGRPVPAGALLATAKDGMTAATADPFLAQRYAFQAVRILFYQRDAPALVAFVDQHAAVLAGPSPALYWRTRYYLAGALTRAAQLPRAGFELAHIHANYPPLAGAAASDFHPQGDTDWRAALTLAKTPREQTELWRLVGVKFDGLAAMREIVKLDPKSDLLAMLMVRELARAESLFGNTDPDDLAANRKFRTELEQLAVKLAATPGADRPWLMNLVAGHLAAERGDLATTRARIQLALAGKRNDPRVASQAKASLALALAATWRIDEVHERELAHAMITLDKSYARSETLSTQVRDQLAKRYLAANKLVDAEYLHPGSVDGGDVAGGFSPRPGKLHWADIGFIKDMIARLGQTTTEFDSFIVRQAVFTEPVLQQELALRYALDGDFVAARQMFAMASVVSQHLEVDPFVTHIKDCRQCDEEKYAHTPWTHASVIARLADLAVKANGTDEPAAEASILIGNALYNFTWLGNARRVLRGTHQDTFDTRPAERWYKRAYELTRNKELKAKAAYLAAKAERGILIDTRSENDDSPGLPVAKTWFPRLKQLSSTRYYKEVLKECETFRVWMGGKGP
jgi:hypothetical protein